MKVAVMQPYFFPYVGYFSLVDSCDIFVMLDDVQYIRRGWINRNRILHPINGWQYIGIPVTKKSLDTAIWQMHSANSNDWKLKLLAQLSVYRHIAPYYADITNLIKAAIDTDETAIRKINCHINYTICSYLGLQRKILSSREIDIQKSQVTHSGSWSLLVSSQLRASHYINPISGAAIYRKREFDRANIHLCFLEMEPLSYSQNRSPFIENLSIIDLLMFNSSDQALNLIRKYQIIQAS